MNVYILIILIFLLIFQGGFYPSAFFLVGISGAFVLMFLKKNIVVTKELIILTVVAFTYLLSVIMNGVSYSTLNYGLIPLICLIVFMIFNSMDSIGKKSVIFGIEILGIISSIFAILIFAGMLNISGGMNAGRLQFTFQYANIAGTWFAVCFILARDSQCKAVRVLSPVNLIALFMTESIGAISILFVLQIVWGIRKVIKYNKDKQSRISLYLILCGIATAVLAVIVVVSRFGQGRYTFIERLIQSYDGLKVMVSHILTGIGAGNWQYVYPFYQSAQYKAGVIHNSYVQIGVSSGIIPMICVIGLVLSVAVKFVRKNDCKTEAACFILLHSMVDYCLSFVCIDVLLIVLLGCYSSGENETVILENIKVADRVRKFIEQRMTKIHTGIKRAVRVFACFLLLGVFCFAYYGTMQIRIMEGMIRADRADVAVGIYSRNDTFMRNGYGESELYVQALLADGRYKEVLRESQVCKKKSAKIQYYEMVAKENKNVVGIDDIIQVAQSQPYNYEMLCGLTELVENGTYREGDIKKYEKSILEINKMIKGKPARWLNNQKELDIKE